MWHRNELVGQPRSLVMAGLDETEGRRMAGLVQLRKVLGAERRTVLADGFEHIGRVEGRRIALAELRTVRVKEEHRIGTVEPGREVVRRRVAVEDKDYEREHRMAAVELADSLVAGCSYTVADYTGSVVDSLAGRRQGRAMHRNRAEQVELEADTVDLLLQRSMLDVADMIARLTWRGSAILRIATTLALRISHDC